MNRLKALHIGTIAATLLALTAGCSRYESACTESRTCSESGGGATGAAHPEPDRGATERREARSATESSSLDGGSTDSETADAPDAGSDGSAAGFGEAGSLAANGSTCGDDSACQSGYCSGHMCCDAACTERFHSCRVTGKEGTCNAVTEVYVDPLAGHDDASGLAGDPLKTLGAALGVAKSGWTIYLEPGTYDASSGESFNTEVPDGVAIWAVVEGNAVLVGTPKDEGLHFTGGGDLKGIVFKGFPYAARATTGTVSIERSTVDGGGGLEFGGNVRVTLDGAVFQNLQGIALSASGVADVQMTGGSIGGIGYVPNCAGASGIRATDSANVRLADVTIHDLGGDGVDLRKAASVTLTRGIVTKTGLVDCYGAEVVAYESSTVSLDHTVVRDGNADGLHVYGDAHGILSVSEIGSHPRTGIVCQGADLTLTGGSIHSGDLGVSLTGSCSGDFDGTMLQGNATGIELDGNSFLKMRNARIIDGDYAIYAPTADPVRMDLGDSSDPGSNGFSAEKGVLVLSGVYSYETTIDAVGNTWSAYTQGADLNGKYPTQVINGPVSGKNFEIDAGNVHIRL